MPPTSVNSKSSDRSSVAEQLHQRGVLVRAPQCDCACKEKGERGNKEGCIMHTGSGVILQTTPLWFTVQWTAHSLHTQTLSCSVQKEKASRYDAVHVPLL